MKNFLIASGFLLITLSCGIKGKFDKIDVRTIEYGSGGGFTGVYKTFVLDIKERTVTKDNKLYKKLGKEDIKELYAMITSGSLHQKKINKPGNKSYFINFIGQETKNKLSWGDPSYNPSKEVEALYQKLVSLTVKD